MNYNDDCLTSNTFSLFLWGTELQVLLKLIVNYCDMIFLRINQIFDLSYGLWHFIAEQKWKKKLKEETF